MIYVGDVGKTLTINTSYNMTGYTAVKIYFVKPTGTIVSVDPTTITAATGVLTYVPAAETFLTPAGDWTIQVVVWFGVNKPMFSDVDTFTVYTPPSNPTGATI